MRTLLALLCLFCFCLPCLAEDDSDARSANAHGDWVNLEQGTKPVYVGIQGGTAPVSLLRSSDGAIFALTGNTGNDFLRVLGKDASSNGTALSSDAAPAPSIAIDDNGMLPFGLSNPEGVSAAVAPAADPLPLENPSEPEYSPLRLHSYKRVLAYSGNL